MRYFSAILFALMTAVLPTAGMPQYFCTMNMEFVDGAEDCPVVPEDCCKKSHKQEVSAPDCMLSAKVIPNADKSTPVHLPSLDSMWTMVPVSLLDVVPARRLELVSAETDRGPPDGSRLFLAHRRLLI